MKKLFLAYLFTALMATGGCSYSWENTTETSVSVDSNGKVETSASSSVYSEKVENGKTVSNKASIAVKNDNAQKSATAKFDNDLSYTVEDADLRQGETEIFGYFMNNGQNTVTINSLTLSFTATGDNGKVIWEDGGEFSHLNLTIKPGQDVTYDFVIKNVKAPAYNGSFNLKYNVNYK